MDQVNINMKIKELIEKLALTKFEDDGLNEKTDLFGEGFIDSFGFVELIAFIEKEFEIKFNDDDMTDSRLTNLLGIVDLVCEKIE